MISCGRVLQDWIKLFDDSILNDALKQEAGISLYYNNDKIVHKHCKYDVPRNRV